MRGAFHRTSPELLASKKRRAFKLWEDSEESGEPISNMQICRVLEVFPKLVKEWKAEYEKK